MKNHLLLLLSVAALFFCSCTKTSDPSAKTATKSLLVNKWYLQRTVLQEYNSDTGGASNPPLDTLYSAGLKDSTDWAQFNADASGVENTYPTVSVAPSPYAPSNFTYNVSGETLTLNAVNNNNLAFVIDGLPLPSTDTIVNMNSSNLAVRTTVEFMGKNQKGASIRFKDVYVMYYVTDKTLL